MLLMISTEAAGDETAAEPAPHIDPETGEPCWMAWYREMTARGIGLKDGAQLQSAATATTVSVQHGDVLLSDGPFAETKEEIVGYNVIECADLDEAIFTAARHPVAVNGGRIEVRPILAG
jgi:hypothetical protein